MKPERIKRMLKPIIKECVNEVLLQEGVLSGVISEVVKGMQTNIVESKKNNQDTAHLLELEKKREAERQERIRRLNESVGADFFTGTTPASDPASSSQHSPLAGVSPGDEGIDIDGIMALAGRKWKNLTK